MPEDFQTYYWDINILSPNFFNCWPDFRVLTLDLLDDYDSFCTYLMISI